ncbi:kinase-like domain-containing protein, partial [Daedaleopsis nitida]
GEVYSARVIEGPHQGSVTVALKRSYFRSDSVKFPSLRHEACALYLLRGHASIPEVFCYGKTELHEIMAMQQLGHNVETRLRIHPTELTIRNLGALAYQMLSAIEHVHSKGILHCDLAPENFVFDSSECPQQLYLIDFGLSKRWNDVNTSHHIKLATTDRMRGKTTFVSLNNHDHYTLSRRDDIEALAYCFAELLLGQLPWNPYHNDTLAVYTAKKEFLDHSVWSRLPQQVHMFHRFINHARSLSFTEDPDYAHWKEEFYTLADGRPTYDKADASTKMTPHPELSQDDVTPRHGEFTLPEEIPEVWYKMRFGYAAFGSLEQSDLLGDEEQLESQCLKKLESIATRKPGTKGSCAEEWNIVKCM